MITTLRPWGNSQGIRLPKTLLAALHVESGASLELSLTNKKDALVVRPVRPGKPVRGRHRIEDLVAAMPKNYKASGFDWGEKGREIW